MLAVVLKTDRNTLKFKKQKRAGGGGHMLAIYISDFGSVVVVFKRRFMRPKSRMTRQQESFGMPDDKNAKIDQD